MLQRPSALGALLFSLCFGATLAACAGGESVSSDPGDGDAAGAGDGSTDTASDDASGSDVPLLDDVDDDAAPDAGADDAETFGSFGDPCTSDDDCFSGFCIEGFDGDLICTDFCAGTCEDDNYECRLIENSGGDLVNICFPVYNDLCRECETNRQCSGLSNLCVELLDGQFCAQDCSNDGSCPDGFECTDLPNSDAQQCLPVTRQCSGCFDPDGDFHGVGPSCIAGDCDEDDATRYFGASELCDGRDNDCDLDIDEGFDFDNDPRYCGGCDGACDIPNAIEGCALGECFITGCEPGFQNLNGRQDDGCEYACVPDELGAPDRPDNAFVDSNCDGIDGDPFRAYFVAPSGADEPGRGTQDAPFRTISFAMQVAADDPLISDLYIAEGEYFGPLGDDGNRQPLRLIAGVNLFGGYDAETWRRTSDNLTRISGSSPAVLADGIATDTEIARLTIEGAAGVTGPDGAGTPSIGLLVRNSPALRVTGSLIRAANGGTGANGERGGNGNSGQNGGVGGYGEEDSTFLCSSGSEPGVGSPGVSSCGNPGGPGGRANISDNDGRTGGTGAGPNPGTGGPGGAGSNATWTGTSDSRGQPGGSGNPGGPGLPGATGTPGSEFAGLDGDAIWRSGAGSPGLQGETGSGGGGGGGGGGASGGCGDLTSICDGWGGGGGGGGGGGCGGFPGTGGAGGGGSFAVYAIDSPFVLERSTVQSAAGGRGGDGGAGGSGGAGGTGGVGGGTGCAGGVGGNGGPGGRGGDGGTGAGGGGGSSFALVTVRSGVTVVETSLTFGPVGAGGGPPSAQGASGTQGERRDIE